MKQKSVIATTYIDRHNMKITKEALESAADQINGEYAPRFMLEHDVTLPPLGKVSEAYVEPMDDGEYRLIVSNEYFESHKEVVLPDGSIAWSQESISDLRPFVRSTTEAPEKIEVQYDPVNFETKQDFKQFIEELKSVADFQDRSFFRKSFIPDPQLIITFTQGIVTYLTGKKVVEKVGDKILDPILEDISKLYALIKASAVNMLRYTVPKNRPVTYVFQAPGNPTIEFVARTNDPDQVINAVLEENLRDAFTKAQELYESVGAVNIQFLLDSDGYWRFNYLLTDSGGVIGIPESYNRRDRLYALMREKNKGK